MPPEEKTLIEIEKQTQNHQQNGSGLINQSSRKSSCRDKMFAPTNVDNLAKKLRLNSNQVKRRERGLKSVDENETFHDILRTEKSVEDGEIGNIRLANFKTFHLLDDKQVVSF